MKIETVRKLEATNLPLSYALLGVGQIWLYLIRIEFPDLFDRLTQNGAAWNQSHVILLMGTTLLIPTTLTLYRLAPKSTLVQTGAILNCLGICLLVGQYAIDMALQPILTLSPDKEVIYDSLFSSKLVTVLFYDLVVLLWIGQMFMAIGILRANVSNIRWSVWLYISGLVLLLAGEVVHPLLPRISYFVLAFSMVHIGRYVIGVKKQNA